MKRILIIWLGILMVGSAIISFTNVGTSDHINKNDDIKTLSGATIYVDDDGTANYTSIQEAINIANEEDTIFVYNGTYYEHLVIEKTITLIGESMSTTIIDGDYQGTVVSLSPNVAISNFTIRNSGKGYWSYFGIGASSNNIIINCNILNTTSAIWGSEFSQIINCNISSSSNVGIFFGNNNTVTQCHFSNNRIPIGIYESSNNYVTYCTISSSVDYGIVTYEGAANNWIHHNNIVNSPVYDAGDTHWYYHGEGNYWSGCSCSGDLFPLPSPIDIHDLMYVTTNVPSGDDKWTGWSAHNIIYALAGGKPCYTVDIYYSTDGGKTFPNMIVTNTTNVSEGLHIYPWVVPAINSSTLRVKVVATDSNVTTPQTSFAITNNNFTIVSTIVLVLSTTPVNGMTSVQLYEEIVIEFNIAMNQISVENAFSIVPDLGGLLFSWSGNNTILTVSHSIFEKDTTYTINIANTAKDDSNPGNYMVTNYTFNFTTRTATIYVDDSGGANYTNIKDALDNSADGDIIYVRSGTYNEILQINNSINLIGESTETTTIGFIKISDNYVNISGFAVKDITIDGYDYNTISNCAVYNNFGHGISLYYSSNNNTITNCSIYNNDDYGIYLYKSSNNQITNCDVYNNSKGIHLDTSTNNQIVSCSIYNNSDDGISLYRSSSNQIINCNIYNNYNGILLNYFSNNNQITNCNIYSNYYGVDIYYGNNYIYHNNIINNKYQVASLNYTNYFDSGGVGNYWSDYTGVDNDGDGIGDTPYTSPDGNIQDNLPLIHPISGILGLQIKFLCATITSNPSTIYSFQSVTINVYVTNGTDPFPNATVQLSDNGAGGLFSSVIDHDNGNYTSIYNAPTVSAQTNVIITVNISKTDYIGCQRTIQVTVKPVLPDLTLSASDIRFSKENIVSGDTVLITVTIHNDGLADATDVQVSFYDNTRLIGSRTVNVSAGASTDVSIEWSIDIFDIGSHDIKVVVNQDNIIVEELTTNNEAKINVSVGISPLIYGSIIILICIIMGLGLVTRIRNAKKLKKEATKTIAATQPLLEEAKKLGLDTKEGEALLEKAKKGMEERR